MADEHKRRPFASFFQERAELVDDLSVRPRMRTVVAPSFIGAIVRADAGKLGDLRLDAAPLYREVAGPSFEHHGRPALHRVAHAEQMEAPAPDIHENPRRGKWRHTDGVRLRPE